MQIVTALDKQMVDQVKGAYGYAEKWSRRVDNMSKGQIQAIHFRLKKEGKI